MLNPTRRQILGGLIAGAAIHPSRSRAAVTGSFQHPPDDARMILYYWWFGPSQEEATVKRELDAMRDAGIGGTFIFPVYPLSASDDQNYLYLSDKFLRVLRSTVDYSRKISMSVDLLSGAGWPFGGPTIRFEDSSRTLRRIANTEALQEGDEVLARDDRTGTVFVSSLTRQRIKGAGLGAEGWVLDHLDSRQVRQYLDRVSGKLVSVLPPGGLRSINFDSLEAFAQTWTRAFPEEFRRRRGYDLIPHMPALWEDAGEDTAHIRFDYWRTLTDLFLDSFARPFHDWTKRRGIALQGKPMGSPMNDLRAFAHVDLAVSEEYDWLEFGGPRWAASGAHIYGQNLVANEGYTWLRQPRYLATLQDIKVGSDVQFLAGINVIIGHGFSYSPEASGIPGWSYYASVFFHPKNTWWPYFKHVASYVQRVSFILREGLPVVDVALFLPEDDEMAASAAGEFNRGQKVIVKTRLAAPGDKLPQFGLRTALSNRSPLVSTIVTNGYNFDGINSDGLGKARIENGRLRVGQGNYGVLVLPRIQGLPVESMEKIQAFARSGGKVIAIGQAPSLCYGMPDWKQKSARVRAIAGRVFGPGGPGMIVPDEGRGLLNALRESHRPDIEFAAADREVGFAHRATPTHDYYFIANTSAAPKRLDAVFRVEGRRPEIWDPLTGESRLARHTQVDDGTKLAVSLGPFGSTIVAFGPSSTPASEEKVRPPQENLPSIAVSGPWSLEIEGTSIALPALRSWTEHKPFRYFSGTGVYRTEFTVEASHVTSNQALYLSLGEVHEIAEVELNGEPLGVAWMVPYRLNLGVKLRAGRNRLVVKVTNLLINRVLGQPAPDTAKLVKKYGQAMAQLGNRQDLKFTQNHEKEEIQEPVVSGLLGPVEIRAEEWDG